MCPCSFLVSVYPVSMAYDPALGFDPVQFKLDAERYAREEAEAEAAKEEAASQKKKARRAKGVYRVIKYPSDPDLWQSTKIRAAEEGKNATQLLREFHARGMNGWKSRFHIDNITKELERAERDGEIDTPPEAQN